jgi:pheromone shutdown protein TraB
MHALKLTSYARLEASNGGVVHLIGGAHVLDSSAVEVYRATTLATRSPSFGGVLLELCHERAPMLTELLALRDPNEPPEVLPPFIEAMRAGGPMALLKLYYEAAEVLGRSRTAREQSAAVIALKHAQQRRGQGRDGGVTLADRPQSITMARVMACALLWANPFLSREYLEKWNEGIVGPIGMTVQNATRSSSSSPSESEIEAPKTIDLKTRIAALVALTREANAAKATEQELLAAMKDARELMESMVSDPSKSRPDPASMSWFVRVQAAAFDAVEVPLLHERDVHLAHVYRRACMNARPGTTFIAVVGAGHVVGVKRRFEEMEGFVAGNVNGKCNGFGEAFANEQMTREEREHVLSDWVMRLNDVGVARPVIQDSLKHMLAFSLTSSACGFMLSRSLFSPLWRRRYLLFVTGCSVVGFGNSIFQARCHWNGVRILQQKWRDSYFKGNTN